MELRQLRRQIHFPAPEPVPQDLAAQHVPPVFQVSVAQNALQTPVSYQATPRMTDLMAISTVQMGEASEGLLASVPALLATLGSLATAANLQQ